MDTLFAVCAPGMEPFVAKELQGLGLLAAVESEPQRVPAAVNAHFTPQEPRRGSGLRSAVDEAGGVEFSGDLRAIYRANLHLRTASRVLVRLGDFYAAVFPELRKKAARLEWERYLSPGQPVAVRATCHKSKLYHSDAVAERVLAAIGDRLGRLAPPGKFDETGEAPPPQLVVVRLSHDRCTISIDSSGTLLHRRGYRQAVAKAPLRETLAAAVLMAAGWDAASPLLDPFCGSGTIPIEAALLAYEIAPGHHRRFAFVDWPGFDPVLWEGLKADACQLAEKRKTEQPNRTPPIIQASDRDAGAIQMGRANAERAGVSEYIEFTRRAVSAIQPPPEPGWVVTNPPYGLRLGSRTSDAVDLRNLYAQFGNVLRMHCPGWRVAVLFTDPRLLTQTRLKLDSRLGLVNGGVAVRLGIGTVR